MRTPAPDLRFQLRAFLLGYGAGVLVFALLTALGAVVLRDPCRGRTAWTIVAPFVLGPGGLVFIGVFAARRGWAAFGLGLAIASLFPALFAAGLTLGALREAGCAAEPPRSGQDRPVNPMNPAYQFPRDPNAPVLPKNESPENESPVNERR